MELATQIAHTILAGFDKHYRLFRETSARAKARFDASDWTAARLASEERIGMYDQRVAEGVMAVTAAFPDAASDAELWPKVKSAYIGLLYEHFQPECAETFFNSVVRRLLRRRYYDNATIFGRAAISTEHLDGAEPTYRCYYPEGTDLRSTFHEVLTSFHLESPFADIERDLGYVMRYLAERFPDGWEGSPNFQVQVLRSLFFRNKSTYVVGRIVDGASFHPFVMPLLKDDKGAVFVDAILVDPVNIGRLFSLGRAYCMVDMDVPAAYVDFLKSMVPQKPTAELYTMLGLQKQGKTLFYRDLEQHLKHSSDRFVLAPGTKGMVMLVFTLPSFPYVFKVIRDWFAPPKDSDRAHVEERYVFVKRHDRVGRLADTLQYSHVPFPKDRISPELLAELERLCPSSMRVEGDRLVLEHLYVERRLVPLDIFLANANDERRREGIVEYGNALRDLAGADIFPGDLLLKNFGVTRYGRVVFYDYDELCPVTACTFRSMPRATTHDDEMSAEPFYAVGPHDVFPEQFPTFLFPEGQARDVFLEAHGELATARFWIDQQARLTAGIQEDMFPYPGEIRFAVRFGN